ncbi:sporulation protein [Paenibacillus aurantius]|uniref:Sporulation protein n=1 Tax=Paenibacillus aurantius TaxID=2918900 RepID=A0AA96LDJ2_9BACL|nr:sporulation protein [Paenibacillus aurantius]WNQ11243.1 sporulation protein [Paenibacillus aurantius]
MAIIALVLYRRVRRTVGFQLYRPRRLKVRMVIFGLIGLLILEASFQHPVSFVADAAGLVLGGVLLLYAVRHTVFEKRESGWFYRTHLWVEMTVVALFLGRLAYRLIALVSAGPSAAQQPPDPAKWESYWQDPLTAGVFFILVVYYVGFYGYVLKRGKGLTIEGPGPTAVR